MLAFVSIIDPLSMFFFINLNNKEQTFIKISDAKLKLETITALKL